MDIRATGKEYEVLRQITIKYKRDLVKVNKDENATIPLAMIQVDGKLVEYLQGFNTLKNLLKYGFNRIIKKCPHRFFGFGKCRGEKCQHYVIENNTGDCATTWMAVTNIILKKGE